jgi:Uma2 family endonuclease
MIVERRLMTADELLAMPDDGMRHELVRGELRTMAPSGLEGNDIALLIASSLSTYVLPRGLGRAYGELGCVIARDPDTVRAPDAAFISRERLLQVGRTPRYFPGAPDLVVEVISPNDLYTEVDEKVAEWLEHGARLVYVVNPRRRTVAQHRPGEPVRILTQDDALDGLDVVPGWSMPIRDLFADF